LKPPTSLPPPPASVAAPAAPRKENARIAATPDKPMKATVRLTGTTPLSSAPAGVIRTALLQVAKQPPTGLFESVPMPLCWILLSVSGLTFLIQLWTYFS
jgi:hypothetical protein